MEPALRLCGPPVACGFDARNSCRARPHHAGGRSISVWALVGSLTTCCLAVNCGSLRHSPPFLDSSYQNIGISEEIGRVFWEGEENRGGEDKPRGRLNRSVARRRTRPPQLTAGLSLSFKAGWQAALLSVPQRQQSSTESSSTHSRSPTNSVRDLRAWPSCPAHGIRRCPRRRRRRSRAPPHRGGRGRGRGERARARLVPRQRRLPGGRRHARARARAPLAPRLRRHGQRRVHADLGRAGERGAARQRRLGGGRRQGQAPLRRAPARGGGDAGGERGPAGRDLRRRRQGGRRPARHGQPWVRLHPEGVPGQRQQPLRAELQMPGPHRQEAQGVERSLQMLHLASL